jgi:hypothetical protein
MSARRSHPKWNKRFILTHEEYDLYSVNALAVRDTTQSDEEFGIFATHEEFPRLIPKNEIWIAEKSIKKEAVFYVADALMRMKERAKGTPDDQAYQAGINLERMLREKLLDVKFRNGRPHKRIPERLYIEHYLKLPDAEFPVAIWLVDGNLVRSWYKTDYVEGGHGYVYRWCPKDEIWIDHEVQRTEIPFLVTHEYMELRLMRDKGLEYDQAHEICSKVEFKVRQNLGIKPFLAPGRRKVTKADLPKLTSDQVFQYVVKNYLKG